jgi:hypothetical protein
MRQFSLFCILFFSLFHSYNSLGQLTSFTGKLVDEHNEPVPGSLIKIYKGGKFIELTADKEGIFSTSNILAGDYFFDINANGRILRAKKIFIQPAGVRGLYYNFKLFPKGVVISHMANKRFIAG